MRVKLFVKQDCPRCPAAKHAVAGLAGLEVYDLDDIDGLAEASFHSVLSTPSVIICDSHGKELAGWRGEVPDKMQLASVIAN